MSGLQGGGVLLNVLHSIPVQCPAVSGWHALRINQGMQ